MLYASEHPLVRLKVAELREAKGHLAQCGEMCEMHMKQDKGKANNAAATKVTDPVCGMKIDAATFKLSAPLAPITRLIRRAKARTMSCMMPR